jgi:hypothetical protein
MTTMLPAAMLAEEVEQTLEDTDPDQRWQVTAAQDILEQGCLGEDFQPLLRHQLRLQPLPVWPPRTQV